MQDVRDKMSQVEKDLPDGIDPPTIEKFDVGAAPIMSVALNGNLGPRELTHLADKVVKAHIERVAGVGGVDLVGAREREIKVLVDPAKLAGLGLTVTDVENALRSQNLDIPGGHFERGLRELNIKTKGEVKTADEVASLAIPSSLGTVRVRDVAEVEDTVEDARSASFLDGESAISLVIRKQSGANTVAVRERVREELAKLEPLVEAQGRVHGGADGQLGLHRALDPRRAVRPAVRRVSGRASSSSCSCATFAPR